MYYVFLVYLILYKVMHACLCQRHGCSAFIVVSPLPLSVRVQVWQRNICAYAVVIVVKMAGGETEKEYDTRKAIEGLRERFQELTTTLKESSESLSEASLRFCQEFCQVSIFFPFQLPILVVCSLPSSFQPDDARVR